KTFCRLILMYVLSGGLLLGAAPAPETRLTVGDVNRQVVCQCGCNMVLHGCTCEFARQMNAEIQSMIDERLNLPAILQRLQEKYGPTVLAAPPKRGFFATAWVLPFIALGLGGGLIAYYLRRRARPTPLASAEMSPPEDPALDTRLRSILESVDR
ncbi:MAG: cytochrome c-type biogenesis protein CcmH, partial [Acidobacteria bacterium]|nr:cytochrome c-type biogenesis protein CcmH [Acidobacteriota bacterium]MDW7984511.1 cytochrome c-type biogenesis protein CcmH [Acidobacteriota bacterium]